MLIINSKTSELEILPTHSTMRRTLFKAKLHRNQKPVPCSPTHFQDDFPAILLMKRHRRKNNSKSTHKAQKTSPMTAAEVQIGALNVGNTQERL